MNLLIVEDDPGIAGFICRGLKAEGYIADWVERGHEAVETLEVYPYDGIILDVLLPDMDGLEVCREIRKRNINKPVLMLTALNEVEDRVNGLDAGADDYLSKPFALVELLARLRALKRRVDQPEVTGSQVLRVNNLCIDRHAHKASLNDQTIDLALREFRLLEFLMSHPGKAFSRSQILENVWGLQTEVTENLVDVYIGYLRRKIDNESKHSIIQTVRGVGYRFSPSNATTTSFN
ncbi:response regulator transcription factor [Terasakiella sp.]|uniref:response regulator transcription factor n=1 Tax=Terasakiella sp. TaxID=2034861 RepID=UPI003AA863CF